MNQIAAPTAIGVATGLSTAVTELSGLTHVPLEVAVPCMVFCCTLVWWLGRKLQLIEDRLKNVEDALKVCRESSDWPH